jgi:hypothetical protein
LLKAIGSRADDGVQVASDRHLVEAAVLHFFDFDALQSDVATSNLSEGRLHPSYVSCRRRTGGCDYS